MTKKIGLLKYEIEHPNKDAETCYRLVVISEGKNLEYFTNKIKSLCINSYLHSIELLNILD